MSTPRRRYQNRTPWYKSEAVKWLVGMPVAAAAALGLMLGTMLSLAIAPIPTVNILSALFG